MYDYILRLNSNKVSNLPLWLIHLNRPKDDRTHSLISFSSIVPNDDDDSYHNQLWSPYKPVKIGHVCSSTDQMAHKSIIIRPLDIHSFPSKTGNIWKHSIIHNNFSTFTPIGMKLVNYNFWLHSYISKWNKCKMAKLKLTEGLIHCSHTLYLTL